MSEKLVTKANAKAIMDQIIESIDEAANTSYYLFAGKSSQYPGGDSVIEVPVDTEDFMDNVYDEMLFGKRVSSGDVAYLIPRHDWESNTVFSQYDDTDGELFSKNFYTSVDDGSFFHVYKCLYNNRGATSTVKPDFAAVSSNDSFYETSDGYHWKYMYSVTDSTVRKFATDEYFPVEANTEVVDSAVTGSIETMVVESGGSGYDNYLAGNNVFGSNDRSLGGNNLLFNISANVSASSANNFYNGCYIFIKSGNNNEAGQYKRITDYQVNSTSKSIVIESPFTTTIGIGAVYDIFPGVVIVGDGKETSNAVARAVINVGSNSVHSIEMLDFGAGYRNATANVEVASELTVEPSQIRAVKSPWFGHGSDPISELGSKSMVVSVELDGTEGGKILATNDFRTVGIIRDPSFANVVVTSSNVVSGGFLIGEDVYTVRPIRVGSNASVNTTSSALTDPAGNFLDQFEPGDSLFITYASSNVASNTSMLTTVNSVVNSTALTLVTNASFAQVSGGVWYSIPREERVGTVTAANTSAFVLDRVVSEISAGDTVVGKDSGAVTTVDGIFRSGVEKDFGTFVNANKYVGVQAFGSFVQDETVTQSSTNTYATMHSVVSNTYFYTTGGYGTFSVANSNITGLQSGAIATLTGRYGPELNFRSGDILYVENIDPVTRDPSQSETFKIIFQF